MIRTPYAYDSTIGQEILKRKAKGAEGATDTLCISLRASICADGP